MLLACDPSRGGLLCYLLDAVLATTHMESVLLGLGQLLLSRSWPGCPSIGQSWRHFHPTRHFCTVKQFVFAGHTDLESSGS